MTTINGAAIKKVIIACDAGMGSSVMVASTLKKQLQPYSVTVDHMAVNSIPTDADVVLVHSGMADRVRSIAPQSVVLPFQVFLGDPAFAKLVGAVRDGSDLEG